MTPTEITEQHKRLHLTPISRLDNGLTVSWPSAGGGSETIAPTQRFNDV